MWWKQYGSVVGMALALLVLSVWDVEAATRAMPGVATAATRVSDTVKTVAWIAVGPILIWTILEVRSHGFGSAMWQCFSTLTILAIALFADEIIETIKPGTAIAFSPGVNLANVSVASFGQLGELLALPLLTALGIRRARHARRV